MKTKFWIKQRVFIWFTIFVIIIVNIFLYLLYFLIQTNTKYTIYNNILNEYNTIKTFIDIEKNNYYIQIPKYEIEKINNLWFFLYIWKNDKNIQTRYKKWINISNDNLIFRWDYKWYNIILEKKLIESKIIENDFFKILLILNLFLILTVLIFINYLTKIFLEPLNILINFLNKYNKKNKNILVKNHYWDTEIGQLTIAINNFIKQNNNILEKQKDFIQDVSHELKTPLMQINSNIEILEEKIDNEKILNKLIQIKNSTENINEIIKNLSFILRWENLNLKKEKINIKNYFQELIKKYTTTAKEKNIIIKLKIIDNFIIINNKYYLDRLFWNIINNAIFYNKGNNTIEIFINKNNINICDQWIWIERNEIKKIFNRFYRNKNSGLYYNNWNWLWLTIVKKICELFNWKIEIKSELWKWTCFNIKDLL